MNQTVNYQMTILVPIFNEEDNIKRLENVLSSYLNISKIKSCILLINDGSNDGSLEMIKEVCNNNNDFFYISLKSNSGLSAAMKAGIDYTFSPYVAYIDADLQTVPDDFNLLIPYIEDYELVTGIRAARKDTVVKKMSSKIANNFRRFMTKDDAQDTGCPLKIIKTECAKKIPFFKGMHRFLPALILLQNGRVKQLPVRHFPRIAGVAKYNLANRLISPLVDCFAYRWMKKRYINYNVNENNL
ncbi:MAG: glycosyltransferase [Bacteroidales bacterium]|nr:glycosyltransferase [Bacteroidales bacterium]